MCGSGSIHAAASPTTKMLCRFRTTKLLANGAALDVGVQKALQLKCTVWALFEEDLLPAVSTSLEISVMDKMCWVQQNLKTFAERQAKFATESACRHACRRTVQCAFWSSHQHGV